MASSVNKAILIGNLGRDPQVRRMNSGESVCSFSLATTESWRDKGSGEKRDRTEWHNVVIFNENLAKVAEQYLKKGSKVYIEGQIQNRKYTDKEGQERYISEVVLQRFRGELTLLDSRGGGSDFAGRDEGDSFGEPARGGGNVGRSLGSESRGGSAGGRSLSETIDDDIPF